MLFQVYLTVIVLALLLAAIVWFAIRKPFLRRWQYETRVEEFHKEKKKEEHVAREAAAKEVDTILVKEPPEETLQEGNHP